MSQINSSYYAYPALVCKASKKNLRNSKIRTNKRFVSYTCVKNIQWFVKLLSASKVLESASAHVSRLSCSLHHFLVVGLGLFCPLHCNYLHHALYSVFVPAAHLQNKWILSGHLPGSIDAQSFLSPGSLPWVWNYQWTNRDIGLIAWSWLLWWLLFNWMLIESHVQID